MKLLKLTLGDGKIYTFQTFSALQQKALKKEAKVYNDLNEELRLINYEVDENGKIKVDKEDNWIPKLVFTQQEKDRIEEIGDLMFDFTVDVFRKSICKFHTEFKKDADKSKDQVAINGLLEIVDMQDLKAITQFALSGIYVKEEDVLDYSFIKPETK